MEAVQCSCTSMAQCMRHAPLDVFTPSCLDMHGEYILTVLPPLMGKQALIGIPLVLPMGWKYSLPFFCAYTETATDLANQQFSTMAHTCPHPLEATINSISVPVLQQCIHMKPIHCISLWLTRMFTWMISWASHNPAPRPKHNRQSSTALMPSSEPSTQRGS
jgi:hypothetical protein